MNIGGSILMSVKAQVLESADGMAQLAPGARNLAIALVIEY